MNMRWFHMTSIGSFQATCAAKHRSEAPGTALSVAIGPTSVLVKVDGASKAWRKSVNIEPSCIRVYDRDDHAEARAMVDSWNG